MSAAGILPGGLGLVLIPYDLTNRHAEHLQVKPPAQRVGPDAAAVDVARSALHGVRREPLGRFLWSVVLVEVEGVGLGRQMIVESQ